MTLTIAEIPAGAGRLAISPMPGRSGRYDADFRALLAWGPDLVLTMTSQTELTHHGAAALPEDLHLYQIAWRHLPITDFGTPDHQTLDLWPEASALAHHTLHQGGQVLIHCFGGCGRSGMAALRLLVEQGEAPDQALSRLRKARPCAVETEAQYLWATQGAS